MSLIPSLLSAESTFDVVQDFLATLETEDRFEGRRRVFELILTESLCEFAIDYSKLKLA